MRTTVTVGDALYEKRWHWQIPILTKADILREAMKVFVRVQAARRLAALGGTMLEIEDVRSRREKPQLK